jgi:hypothetical protein
MKQIRIIYLKVRKKVAQAKWEADKPVVVQLLRSKCELRNFSLSQDFKIPITVVDDH